MPALRTLLFSHILIDDAPLLSSHSFYERCILLLYPLIFFMTAASPLLSNTFVSAVLLFHLLFICSAPPLFSRTFIGAEYLLYFIFYWQCAPPSFYICVSAGLIFLFHTLVSVAPPLRSNFYICAAPLVSFHISTRTAPLLSFHISLRSEAHLSPNNFYMHTALHLPSCNFSNAAPPLSPHKLYDCCTLSLVK